MYKNYKSPTDAWGWKIKLALQALIMLALAGIFFKAGPTLGATNPVSFVLFLIVIIAARLLLDDKIASRITALSMMAFMLCLGTVRTSLPVAFGGFIAAVILQAGLQMYREAR